MSENHQQVSNILHQKRTAFANQIRRNQRKQIIGEKRKVLYQQHLKQLVFQKIQLQNLSYEQLFSNIGPGQFQYKYLMQLLLRLQSPNQNHKYMIELLFQSKKYCYLLDNLAGSNYIKQTLNIFSFIMAKTEFRFTTYLISKGFIQALLQVLGKYEQYCSIIANIIGNLCIDSEDTCEVILQNYYHEHFINMFYKLYSDFESGMSTTIPQQTLKMVLWMMGIVVGTRQSTFDFTCQYDQIVSFCKDLMQKRVLAKEAIEIIYELSQKNKKRVHDAIVTTVNNMLNQITQSSPQLQNLLYLIYKLTPGEFRYDLIWKITFLADYKIAKIALMIIQRLQDRPQAKQIGDQNWWEKMLVKINNSAKQHKLLLNVMRNLRIVYPCVFRFVSEYLDEAYNKDTMSQILIYLRQILLRTQQDKPQKMLQLVQNLRKYNVQKSLQRIIDRENISFMQRARQLLFLMESMTREVIETYHFQIQQ